MKKYKDWLEEVWNIKGKIAKDTEAMSFSHYLKYLKNLAQKAEKRISLTPKVQGVRDKKK